MPDSRRWTLRRSHPMTTRLDGPNLSLGETVEVMPVAEVAAQVALLRADQLYEDKAGPFAEGYMAALNDLRDGLGADR